MSACRRIVSLSNMTTVTLKVLRINSWNMTAIAFSKVIELFKHKFLCKA